MSGSQGGGDAQGSEAALVSWGLVTESAWRETEARAPRHPEPARKRAADPDAALPVWAWQVRSRWQGGGRYEGRRWTGQGGRALVGGRRPVFVARGRDTVTARGGYRRVFKDKLLNSCFSHPRGRGENQEYTRRLLLTHGPSSPPPQEGARDPPHRLLSAHPCP